MQRSPQPVATKYKHFVRSAKLILSLIFFDLAAYTAAFALSVAIREFLGKHISALPNLGGEAMRFGDLYFMPLLLVLIFFYEQLYQRRVPFVDEMRDIAKAVFILTIFLFALISIGKMAHIISRLTIIILAPLSILFIGTMRYWGKILLYKAGIGRQNFLIIGDPKIAAKFKAEITREKTLGYKYCGFLSEKAKLKLGAAETSDLNPVGTVKDIPRIIHALNIECMLIASANNQQKTQDILTTVHKYVEHVLLIPEMKSGALLNSELYHLFVNQSFLLKMRNSLREASARFIKMAFDYLLVFVSLPFSLPFLLLVALIIKATSKGPVLYTQLRVGQHGKTIRMYKFRSMYPDAEHRLKSLLENNTDARAEWKKYHKLKKDPRITSFGAFIRKTSIDELPQLINVVLGNMSLVGPRPVPLDEFAERYAGKSDYYCLVRPGMTGLWQISGRSDISFPQRILMDTWYVFNWSLFIDFVILYKTIGVVVKKRGAY